MTNFDATEYEYLSPSEVTGHSWATNRDDCHSSDSGERDTATSMRYVVEPGTISSNHQLPLSTCSKDGIETLSPVDQQNQNDFLLLSSLMTLDKALARKQRN